MAIMVLNRIKEKKRRGSTNALDSESFMKEIENLEQEKEIRHSLICRMLLCSKEIKFLLEEIRKEIAELDSYDIKIEDKIYLKEKAVKYLQCIIQ